MSHTSRSLSLLVLVLVPVLALGQPQFGDDSVVIPPFAEDMDNVCMRGPIEKMVRSGALSASDPEAAEQLFEHCVADFLDNHPLSEEVKTTVDKWLGTDLSQAKDEDYLELFDRAQSGIKPPKYSEKFREDCNYLGNKYDYFVDQVHPLGSIILDIQTSTSLVVEQQRKLLNFALYIFNCRSILQADPQTEASSD